MEVAKEQEQIEAGVDVVHQKTKEGGKDITADIISSIPGIIGAGMAYSITKDILGKPRKKRKKKYKKKK